MKKVLVIAHQFPPMGGSGVQRTTKFVKYLGHFQWEPVVLTREVKNMQLTDKTLLNDIPEGIKVIRTASWDLATLPGFLGLAGKIIGKKILIPDSERLWEIFSCKRALQSINDDKIDLIYTTSTPYSDHLLGLYLKRKFPRLPWVADFRDEWTNNPYTFDHPHNFLRANTEKKLESDVLKHADSIVTNTPVMMNNFISSYSQTAGKFHVIPNGYDEADFKDMPSERSANSKFTVTYTGLLYGRRKPDTFFEAARQLTAEGLIDRDKLKITLIGNYKVNYMNELINKFDLSGVVELLPYMEHRECILKLIKSDALLLIEGNGPGSNAFYTGKIFEYMNTGRPVIAVIPEKGAAAQLVREAKIGEVADFDDIEGIKKIFLTNYKNWFQKAGTFTPEWEIIRKFERKELTRKLSEIFDEAMSGNPTVV